MKLEHVKVPRPVLRIDGKINFRPFALSVGDPTREPEIPEP